MKLLDPHSTSKQQHQNLYDEYGDYGGMGGKYI